MKNMYDHQDWTPVILKKRTISQEQQAAKKAASQFLPQYKAKLDENTEDFANKKFEKTYISSVIQKRVERKLTQKDLARLINVDIHVIQKFEQGNEVYDHILKNKLNRALGITNTTQ